MKRIAVIYLSRKGNDPRFSRAFLTSLIRNSAGIDFELVYLLKGYDATETDQNFAEIRPKLEIPWREIRFSDERFATNVILDALTQIDHEMVLFLTSFSRIRAPNWLKHYHEVFSVTPNCGSVGATSGYETIPGTTFPNPNLRLNACYLPRKLMLDLDPGPLKTKLDGNFFEAGPNSFTRQIIARGLKPVVVDRFGRGWSLDEWPRSLTFRSGKQEGLLISDNRTYHYDVASNRKRRRLAELNWAQHASVPKVSLLERLAAWWEWNYPTKLK